MSISNKTFNHLKTGCLTLFLALCIGSTAFAQHRGDDLAFQGIDELRDYDVQAMAMGNAYTSLSGELASLFYNPAGLATLDRFAISVSVNTFEKKWHENQEYRPNRLFVTLPFYLEELYIPDPTHIDTLTGLPMWDSDLAIDSSYQVQLPETGLQPFSEQAADWVNQEKGMVLNSVAFAYPLEVMKKGLVLSAAYKNNYNVLDFDRNETYLDPHLGYTKYNMPERVSGLDTIRVNWYRYMRQRTGNFHTARVGLGVELSKQVQIGFGMTILNGETEDVQSLDQHGYFDLADQNRFRFGYALSSTQYSGTSTFSSVSANIGGIYHFENFALGVNVLLPRTLTREWDYSQTVTDSSGSKTLNRTGTDEMSLPPQFTFGFHLTPSDIFLFSLDYQFTPFSNAEFDFADANTDTTHNAWVDQHILRFGAQFKLLDYLTLLGGYQYIPQTFVPDGSAFRDRGPAANSYSMGLSLDLYDWGRIDVSYEMRKLRYYDQYSSNTNYNVIDLNNLSIGYSYMF
ncbi:hypothetical protein GF406_13555 [candidate division KSB1 bacterium]|nr:hypothetical protein [candidate division KSB1 bacterium]